MRAFALLFTLLVLLVAPLRAEALTLDDLVLGTDIVAANGITFDSFTATLSGALAATSLADYTVTALTDGFQILGPSLPGTTGTLVLTYAATAAAATIAGATLGVTTNTVDAGALALVAETILGAGLPIQLIAFDLEGIASQLGESVGFAAPVASLSVVKVAHLTGGSQTGLPTIDQTFLNEVVVPEPGAAILLGTGLAGLLAYGRRLA